MSLLTIWNYFPHSNVQPPFLGLKRGLASSLTIGSPAQHPTRYPGLSPTCNSLKGLKGVGLS